MIFCKKHNRAVQYDGILYKCGSRMFDASGTLAVGMPEDGPCVFTVTP